MADSDGFVGLGGDLEPRTLLRAYAEGCSLVQRSTRSVVVARPAAIIDLDPKRGCSTGALRLTAIGTNDLPGSSASPSIALKVMLACGENRDGGTWVPEMPSAYVAMHRSVTLTASKRGWENLRAVCTACRSAVLRGGVDVLSRHGRFEGALAALVSRLRERGSRSDIQMTTQHTERLGAINISRMTIMITRSREEERRSLLLERQPHIFSASPTAPRHVPGIAVCNAIPELDVIESLAISVTAFRTRTVFGSHDNYSDLDTFSGRWVRFSCRENRHWRFAESRESSRRT